jgi:hypothetical protein
VSRARPSETGSRASTEPSSTVSALTGFDPARKSDVFQIMLNLQTRRNYIGNGIDAANALYWLHDHGASAFNGSDYAKQFTGAEEAKRYVEAARDEFAAQMRARAIELALADLEIATASAIEAATADETTETDSTEGESAVPKADAQTPPGTSDD